ncbi:MAG: hopanoid biosynthesis-associated RND transporter HpnN, partial [Deltaproteobacteria bacterium]|nr:hopanoid biosynthesis-associated RND transporter HpnN [Deltaproteobacteria bacterium]
MLERWLAAWVAMAIRQERRVVAATACVTLLALVYAALNLGVNMDNKTTMLSPDLPFQQRMEAFEERFPLLNDALLVVVDGPTGDAAREAARRLAGALEERPDVARSVFVADADPFFERHALLYRSLEEVETFSDQLVRFQPVLGALSQQPDLATLTDLIRRALPRAQGEAPTELGGLLDGFGEATVAVYAERPVHVSWQDLLLRESSFGTATHSTLVVDPVLDFDALLPAGRPLSEIRATAAGLGIGPARELRVRITGYPALNDEEMRGLVTDVGIAGLFSFAMVLLVLGWAFRSGSMVAASALTLVVGLIWTAAFAAFAVGRLNVVSIAFAVLFIGLGVDFAIHLGLHVLEERRRGRDHEASFVAAVQQVGPALVLCSVSTAIGFFAFVPTDYKGVAELGLISGTGMFVILTLTLTLLPALLTRLLPIGPVADETVDRASPSLPPGLVLAGSVLAALFA